MGVYRLELASSGRAVCKNKECKDNQVKIEKGSLRFCTQVEMGGHQSWAYKHWGCVTPVQIQNLNKAIENNLDYLDGYAELDPSLQMVVEKALKEGHVEDSDWRGDVEHNRPGIKGVRKTASKKKQPIEKSEFRSPSQADADGSLTTSQPTQIKRGHDNTNEVSKIGHTNGNLITEIKTASRRSSDNLEKDIDAVEPRTKKLKSDPKNRKMAQAGDAESEPKLVKDLSKRKKVDSKKIGPSIGGKEVKSEQVIAPSSGSSSRRPRRERATVSTIGAETDNTNLESNASKNDGFARNRKAQTPKESRR